MTIYFNLTKEDAEAIQDPKMTVAYNDNYTVYTDTDLDTPPANPAEQGVIDG